MQRFLGTGRGPAPTEVSGRSPGPSLASDRASPRAAFRGTRAAIALALVVAVAVNAAIAWHASYTVEGLESNDFQLVRQALILLAVAGMLVMRVLARSQRALESAQRRRQALAELAHQVVAAPSQSALFEEAVAVVTRTLKVDYCTLLELLPEGRALTPRATAGHARAAEDQATVEVGSDALAERILATGRLQTVEDLPAEVDGDARPPREPRFRSGIGVPIRVQGRPFGVLSAYSVRHRTFSGGEPTSSKPSPTS